VFRLHCLRYFASEVYSFIRGLSSLHPLLFSCTVYSSSTFITFFLPPLLSSTLLSSFIRSFQVINRSPKYKNKYVHRRTSSCLSSLTPEEVRSPPVWIPSSLVMSLLSSQESSIIAVIASSVFFFCCFRIESFPVLLYSFFTCSHLRYHLTIYISV
jgi:hypothetical protein